MHIRLSALTALAALCSCQGTTAASASATATTAAPGGLFTEAFVRAVEEGEPEAAVILERWIIEPGRFVTARIEGFTSTTGPGADGTEAYGERFTYEGVGVDVYVRRVDCAKDADADPLLACHVAEAGRVPGAQRAMRTHATLLMMALEQDERDKRENLAGQYLGGSAFLFRHSSKGRPVESIFVARDGYEYFVRVVDVPSGVGLDGVRSRVAALLGVLVREQPKVGAAK